MLLLCLAVTLHLSHSTVTIEQIPEQNKNGILSMNPDDPMWVGIEDAPPAVEGPYKTWYNRRLHTLDLWSKNDASDVDYLGQDKWYTMEYYMDGVDGLTESFNDTEETALYYSWNLKERQAFTYLNFVNVPLSPETVLLEITTTMFDIGTATVPLETSADYTKYTFKFNTTHLIMWVNDVMAIKLFLRDIPADLGDTKYFKFKNMTSDDKFKIYYWDPTVFCWTTGTEECYEDQLPEKFHFDRESWTDGDYDYMEQNTCKIVNCTYEMLEEPTETSLQSDFARCVRLYHTAQGESDQRVLLRCTNQNYTYTACEEFPDKPCWYEVCDNFDLCNSAPAATAGSLLTLAFVWLLQ